MKTQIALYLGVGTVEELRARATATQAPIGDLTDLLLRVGLERLTDDQIRAWVKVKRTGQGAKLRVAERAIIEALERLEAADAGAFRFPMMDVARASGLKTAEAYLTLQALQGRGLLGSVEGEECDRWGRPVSSIWWRLAAKAKAGGA